MTRLIIWAIGIALLLLFIAAVAPSPTSGGAVYRFSVEAAT
jgi:hypothetical protein